MPETQQLLDDARFAVQLATEAGAGDAVAGCSWGRALEFQWRDGHLERVQEDISRSLGIALYVDGRFSTHSTNDLDRGRLRGFVAEAVALTRCLEPDPFRKIPEPELYRGRAELDLDLVDRSLESLGPDERIRWLQEMDEAAHGDPDVISATSGISDSFGRTARVSSNGFEGAVERSSIWYGSDVTIRDGETKRPEASRWVGALHREGLPPPGETAKEALRRALARRAAKKAPSVRTAMVVDPEAAPGLLGRIFGALSAGAIQQKQSWLAGKLGEPIASPLLTMIDDPHRPRGLGSRLWDGEGIASRRMSVVEAGVLKAYYVDTYYGRKLGWKPTTGSTSNIVFAHGDKDLKGLLEEVGEGVYVNSWLGGNANGTTGDFSFGIRGHMLRGGELAEPVSEMNVSGNYLELLQKLLKVGNDPVPWSAFRTPSLVFEGIQFSGA
jgi:PmbA protein